MRQNSHACIFDSQGRFTLSTYNSRHFRSLNHTITDLKIIIL
jgi:hypothetical protein